MAIKTDKETGRPNRSYKKLYLDSQKKYNELLEKKVGINQIPHNPPSDMAVKDKEQSDGEMSPTDSQVQEVAKEKLEQISKQAVETPSEPPTSPQEEEKPKEEVIMEEKKKEVEIEEDKTTTSVNPDDYNYCCSECKELFNDLKDGACPSCGEELE